MSRQDHACIDVRDEPPEEGDGSEASLRRARERQMEKRRREKSDRVKREAGEKKP